MPAIAETYSLGLPVEVSKIDQELKKLWQESEGRDTRITRQPCCLQRRRQAR